MGRGRASRPLGAQAALGSRASRHQMGCLLNPSLSVILPVYNAQRQLARQVANLLEVLPDLTARFEILIVDDGSTDHTDEIAHELRAKYPQLKIARHAWQRGMAAAVQTGMARSCGDIVFVQEEGAEISPADLRRLWELRGDERLILARAHAQPKPLSTRLLERLSKWGLALQQSAQQSGENAGIQMIRRQAVEELKSSTTSEAGLTITQSPGTQIARADAGHAAQPQRVPSFLKHLRDLAIGE